MCEKSRKQPCQKRTVARKSFGIIERCWIRDIRRAFSVISDVRVSLPFFHLLSLSFVITLTLSRCSASSRDVVPLIYVNGLLPVCGKTVGESETARERDPTVREDRGTEARKEDRKSSVRVAADSAWTVQG